MIDAEWIIKAIDVIKSGIANKLENDNVIIYKCGKIIRIDIKCVPCAIPTEADLTKVQVGYGKGVNKNESN